MKVICRKCGELVEEKQAIKLNEVDYKRFTMNAFQFYDSEYNQYTQICIKCWKNKK